MIGAVTGVFWFLPHYGSPMMDMVWRSLLLTAVYWSVVHVLGIAPELGTQARKLLRGFGASLKRG